MMFIPQYLIDLQEINALCYKIERGLPLKDDAVVEECADNDEDDGIAPDQV